jgi:hypothetical protein
MNNSQNARPLPPNMTEDGIPEKTYLRTSRAAQADTDQVTLPPRPVARYDGLLPRMFRGIFAHWYFLGLGALAFIGVFTGIQKLVIPALNNLQDQWHYGDSRIVQLDANVGHGGMSHFLAQWYHRRILVIEIPANNPHAIHTYSLEPLTTNGEGTIKLIVEDENHDGRPDLVIQIDDNPMAIILYNTGTAFTTGSEV